MDPTEINSQEHEGDFNSITQFSNSAGDENVDHPSADEVNQTYVSPPQVTENSKEIQCGMGTGMDTTQEMSSDDDGSEIENNVENGEEKYLEKDDKESLRKTQDPEDVGKEIEMQKAHDYCPICTHNITGTTKLFEKGKETFPYNSERFVLVIVFSFKYPFIYIPWFYKNTQVPSDPKRSNTSATLLEKIRETLLPRLTPTSQRFLLVLVLLLLSVILLLTLPSPPSPPPPPPNPSKPGDSTETNVQPRPGENVQKSENRGNNRGGVFFTRLTNFLSNNYLSIILLLFLAILAVLWRSMLEVQENDSQKTGATTNPQKLDTDTNTPVTEVTPAEKPKNNEGPGNDSQETGPVTNPLKLDGGSTTDQAKDTNPQVTEVIPETKDTNTEVLPPAKKPLLIKIDILKSIVYGGLIESITSFGVVSSAAASGTSTLNVLALGLANLFSGLFIIIHNLYGLFRRSRYESWNNDHMPELVSVDPYEELLGKRNRVILHCFVVLNSFVFFGVIPPLFYGFSFKFTDKGQYQEAAVVIAASLVCVISLSFAKAYAFGMDKLKTVAAYTGIAIAGSALSFVASHHARDVFAKYDFHKLASEYLQG